MLSPVTLKQKQFFLKWFLNKYKLKRQECVYMLEYIIRHKYLLKNIHFVSDAINYPKGMIITCYGSDEIDFQFHKQHIFSNNVIKSLHEIRFHPKERMFIQLNFHNADTNPFYQRILEDRYFAHENKYVQKADRERAEQLLQKVMIDGHLARLEKQIDEALDQNDKRLFLTLSEEWIKIKKEIGRTSQYEME